MSNPLKRAEAAIQENEEGKFRTFISTEFLIRFQDEAEWK